jgi:tetratricopeptide (TPR) repeat protein
VQAGADDHTVLPHLMRPSIFMAVLLAVWLSTVEVAAAALRQTAPPAASTADPAVAQRVARARDALLTGSARPNEIIAELKAILAVDPELAEPHALLGLAYRSVGSNAMLAEAVAELRQALALDPSLAAARYYLAGAYMELGRPERARDELATALERVPNQPQFLTLLADAERRSGNPQRGLEIAQQVVSADPNAAEARYYAAMCLLDLARRAEAAQQLEMLVAGGAAPVQVTSSLGTIHLEDGRIDDAIRLLGVAVQQAPSRPDLHILLARAHRLRGGLADAEAQLVQALPPGAAQEASTFYEDAAADIRLETGLIRLAQGRLDEALAELEQAAELRPAHGTTQRHLAEVYLRQGRPDRASAHAARARDAGEPLPAPLAALLAPAPSNPAGSAPAGPAVPDRPEGSQ